MPNENSTAVRDLTRTDGYNGFFKMGIYEFQHRQFSDTYSPVIKREVFERGNAVAVLPYDPETDTVLLIRQFLIGAHLAGVDNCPFQVIAGMVEAGESGIDVARREALEEAGCDIGQVVAAHTFLPSPGGSSERIETFVAEARDLKGGQFGLVEENEDIQAIVVSADEAIAMLDCGEIEAGPAVVLLSYFARHHTTIRTKWLADAVMKAQE